VQNIAGSRQKIRICACGSLIGRYVEGMSYFFEDVCVERDGEIT
jgi:hypothetical protein